MADRTSENGLEPTATTTHSNNLKLLRNVLIKATVLFILLNLLYYITQPLSLLNKVSVYNVLVPGRSRLPFSEYPDVSYNLIMANIDQMLASHEIARPKAADEYRVVMIGDSSVWGYLLSPDQTQAACLNRLGLTLASGKKVEVYNLGYPTLTVMKDYLILRHALVYQPDLIVWPVTLASLYPSDQLDFEIIHSNYDEVAALIGQYNFKLYQWPLPAPTWTDHTLIGQRRQIADWLRYQLYGLGWAATGIDHQVPKFVTPHATEFSRDTNILTVGQMHLATQGKISPEDLSFDIMKAAVNEASSQHVQTLIINEPMYRGNNDVRWNTYYPKWAYDSYRDSFRQVAANESWHYVDWWDAVPNDQFTDTDFHMTPQANCDYAQKIAAQLGQH